MLKTKAQIFNCISLTISILLMFSCLLFWGSYEFFDAFFSVGAIALIAAIILSIISVVTDNKSAVGWLILVLAIVLLLFMIVTLYYSAANMRFM